MGTILRDKIRDSSFFHSIQSKMLLTYLTLFAITLVVFNIYPMIVARDIVFASKQTSMQTQATLIETSLEALENVSYSNVRQVMEFIDTEGLNCVIIANADGSRVYKDADGTCDDVTISIGIRRALDGKDVFHSVFKDGAFESSACTPVMDGDEIIGAVFIYEHDVTQGAILLGLQNNLHKMSIAVAIIVLAFSIFFSKTITRRIRSILDAIATVREGEYNYRVEVNGKDEIAQLADEFNSLTGRLQTTEEARKRFVSDASHELKTPLASIRLLSDSILQNQEMDSDTLFEFVKDIGNEAERLARITEKLLNLTRKDNKIVAEKSEINVKSVILSTLRMLKPIAEKAEVTIVQNLSEDCYIIATEDDIYQAVLNLAENAVKYNVKGGKVFIDLYRESRDVIIKIEDTGVGIPMRDLPYIFDRFYRVDKARSRESGGSGLGLSIVKAIVAEHGGTITASRREEGGMCFKVVFPMDSNKLNA